MTYRVYQIKVARQVYDYVNEVGHEAAAIKYPEYGVSMAIRFQGSAKWEPSMFAYFSPVCEMDASDLEEVFNIGNIGPEEKITRLARMHSVSVGDIIEDSTGEFHMVDDFGFEKIQVN